jgi:hypothetical protein
MAPKRTFGHARRGGQTPPTAETPAPASLDSLSEEEYARLVEPLRQSTDEPAGDGRGLVALFTTSSYRYWLWAGVGVAVLALAQGLGFGGGALDTVLDRGRDAADEGAFADGVEITELTFDETVGEGGGVGVYGQLRNEADGTVVGLTIALALHDCPDGYSAGLEECTHHDEVIVAADAEVSSGEAGAFRGEVPLDAFPEITGTLEVTYRLEGAEVE